MTKPGDIPRSALLPPAPNDEATVYILKLTDREVDKLLKHNAALTFAIDETENNGRLTVDEDVMSFSLRPEKPDNYELYSKKGPRCQRVGQARGVLSVNNRQLSDTYREKIRERTTDSEKKKHSRQLLVKDSSKGAMKGTKGSAKSTRTMLRDMKHKKVSRPRPTSVPPAKRPRLSLPSLNGSASTPDRHEPKPSASLNAPKPRPSLPHSQKQKTNANSLKSKIPISSRHATPSPAISRTHSPDSGSPNDVGEDPVKSAENLRSGVMHILALGKTSLTTLRERLPEFEYTKKANVLKEVGKYTGEGYVLEEKYWDDIDPCWPHYTPEEQELVEETRQKNFVQKRSREVVERMPAPPQEQKTMTDAFARAWARWGNEKRPPPRPEITTDEMEDDYRNFYNRWIPCYQAIGAQVDILVNYFNQYAEVFESLEYKFEHEVAAKRIEEIAGQWAERRKQALVLMASMQRELLDTRRKIEKWTDRAD